MASTPKRRPIPKSTNPSPSSSSSFSHSFLVEPSSNFFPTKAEFFNLVAVITIAASVAMACNYFITLLNRHPKPFCHSNVEFDDSLLDVCEPCPSNGVCYEGKLECLHGYTKHGRLCVEDGDINEIAKKLAKLVEIHVCESYAQYLCEGTGKVWVREDDAWNISDELQLKEHYGTHDAIYVLAKQRAMKTASKLLERRENGLGYTELKCPQELVEQYKPLACYVRQWTVKHALVLVPICALLLGGILILLRVRRRYYLSVRAEELYVKVCAILEENALISRSVNGEGESWVAASWLRDHLLLPKERRDPLLWKKVEELVQEDTRLMRYPKMVKGESKVVWEWQVEGSLRSSGKRTKGDGSNQKLSKVTNLGSNHQWSVKAVEPLY